MHEIPAIHDYVDGTEIYDLREFTNLKVEISVAVRVLLHFTCFFKLKSKINGDQSHILMVLNCRGI